MALGRVVELAVGEPGAITGLLISGLHITFSVEKSMKLSENFAVFDVRNAKADTRNKVLKKGNNLIFSAGHEDEGVSTIFIGQITEASTKKDGADWVTNIKAVSSRGQAGKINAIPISLSFSTGSLLSSVIAEVALKLDLVVFGLSNANIPLPNGWVYAGTTNGALRYIQDILINEGNGIYFDNDELVVYKIGTASKIEIVYLTYAGGLLNIEDVTEPEKESQGTGKKRKKVPLVQKKVRYESILIPQLQINAPVIVKGTDQDGTYINEQITYEGDNFGGDFSCKGEAVA